MKGKVILYDYDGTLISSCSYANPKDRVKKLDSWVHQVGVNRYQKMYYHVIPESNPEFVSKIGVNTNKKLK